MPQVLRTRTDKKAFAVATESTVRQGIADFLARAFGKSRIKQVSDAMAFPQAEQVRQHLQRRARAFVILDARVHPIARR